MLYMYLIIIIFCWGTGQTLLKIGFEKSTPLDSYFMGGLVGSIVWMPYFIWNPPKFKEFTLFLPLCLAVSLCYLTYYYALNAGELSISSAILGTYPMYTVLFSVFVAGEQLVTRQWLGLIVIIAGIGLLSFFSSKTSATAAAPQIKAWLFLSLVSAILMGIADAMTKIIIDRTSVSDYCIYFNISQVLSSILLTLAFERKSLSFKILNSKYSLAGIFLLNIGGIAFTISLANQQASILVPLSSSYLALVTILSWLFLGEKMSATKVSAIAIVIAGIMMI